MQHDSNPQSLSSWMNTQPLGKTNGWVFVYELSGCGLKSCCSHLNFRYRTCSKQEVSWHSGKYRVQIHSEMRTWHDKNIQSQWLQFQFREIVRVIAQLQFSVQWKPSTKFTEFKSTTSNAYEPVTECVMAVLQVCWW